MFDLQVTAKAQIEAGTVRALAVTGAHRSSLLPRLPTVAESGLPGFEVSARFGIFGPARLPPAVVETLNRNGGDPEVAGDPAAFQCAGVPRWSGAAPRPSAPSCRPSTPSGPA